MPNLRRKTSFYHQLHFLLKFMHSRIIKEQAKIFNEQMKLIEDYIYKGQ